MGHERSELWWIGEIVEVKGDLRTRRNREIHSHSDLPSGSRRQQHRDQEDNGTSYEEDTSRFRHPPERVHVPATASEIAIRQPREPENTSSSTVVEEISSRPAGREPASTTVKSGLSSSPREERSSTS